ncbi:MAG: C10 family peptidase [Bacteroidales bacterium]|nr:C10 family peptidase [Bacteroidales bacterium]
MDESTARTISERFARNTLALSAKAEETVLAMTTESFFVYNFGTSGFVIVSSDDRFRPIVGYSNEGPFAVEDPSPEAMFYLEKINEARTSRNAILFDNTAEEWQSVLTTGKLPSRNGGRGADFICTTLWNQNSPYNLYSPQADGGPGGRCYAGCVATAMSQVMKRWNHPAQGTGSHSYWSGYGQLSANFGNTTYDWNNMPDRLGGASQEEIEAVALLMYHCAVAVDMDFSPTGSGASSWDVPSAIKQHFSYSNQASIKSRDNYSLVSWQNMLKESFDLGWPVYYSGYNQSGGHAFVCDGYDDDDLFHFNWGWGGNSDGWFVIDEIDYASWAQAIFNFVPSDVYTYMPLQPENFSATPSGDFDYAATLQWTNPTKNIHNNNLTSIDQIVVTRNGEIIYTQDNVTPGTTMTYTDYYMPAIVNYGVYAVVHNAQSHLTLAEDVLLGPTCTWTVEMNSSDSQGWKDGSLSFINATGDQVAEISLKSTSSTHSVELPLGHIEIIWNKPLESISNIKFNIKNSAGVTKVEFDGDPSELGKGLFYIANNTCNGQDDEINGPSGLSVQNANNHSSLTWEAPDGLEVINYHIYRDNVLLAVTSDRNFTDNREMDAFHHYYVTAFTDHGETVASNTVDIEPESTHDTPINLRYEMTSPTKVMVMWDAPEGVTPSAYFVFRRVKGQEFKRIKIVSNTYYTNSLTAQPNNHYEYAVTAYYQADDSQSGFATVQGNPEKHFIQVNKTIIPQHLDYTIQNGHVVLQWDEATLAESYNVYRDGQLIGNSNSTEFIDNDAVVPNDYHYTVTGKTAFLESNPSNMIHLDWTTGTSDHIVNQNVAIYPNPTVSKVTIEGTGISQIRIFNMVGQLIYDQVVSQDRTVIDLSEQPSGCYFVEVVSDQGIATNKLLKTI